MENSVDTLLQDIALEYVLIDSSEPDMLSDLQPKFEEIYEKSKALHMEELSEKACKTLSITGDIIEGRTADIDTDFKYLGDIISEMATVFRDFKGTKPLNTGDEVLQDGQKEQDGQPGCVEEKGGAGEGADGPDAADIPDVPEKKDVPDTSSAPEAEDDVDSDVFKKAESCIRQFREEIGSLCYGETESLKAILDTLDSLSITFEALHSTTFLEVLTHCRTCVEAMIANEDYNTTPLEDGLNLLKAILISLKKDEDFQFDISDTIEVLTRQSLAEKKEETAGKEELKQDSQPAAVSGEESDQTGDKNQADVQTQDSPAPLSEEDCEILTDFISEAEDNLSTIEINLVDLEQNPEDSEIINNIFRPFHTIKGVAGFLNLTKINRLSHTTETFLDSARSGEFIINDRATDAVLESVDLLKKLLERVSQGLARGLQPRDHDIDIENLRHKLQALQVDMAGSGKEPLGEILVKKGVMDEQAVNDSLNIQQQTPEKRIGEIFIDEHKADAREVASALMDQKVRKKAVTTQVKVETGKLDDLVDLAGELVIAQSMLKQKADMVSGLAQSMGHLGQIISNIQNVAMSMRMVPIKSTFMKMIRLVRDLSRKSKKDVDLVMSGEDTEIDRNVVDALYEPLVHMIRNSADHGIESQTDRADKGKPVKGTISLRAYHRGGNIIIEIEDDGRGLDREVILKKALSTGIVSSGEKLSDSEVYELIMKPGFSTSETITDVSGRGVGMDVVKKGLEKLRGSLAIDSSPGKGSKFTISLPLTLAIIDGMLVRVGKERYVIPTMAIQRSFKPKKDQCFTVEGKGEMISDRNTLIPLISMEDICSTPCDAKKPWEGLVIVVEAKEEQRGILIDELLGKDEYVIKSLGSSLEAVKGFSGGAILADGKVGLILDIHDMFKLASM